MLFSFLSDEAFASSDIFCCSSSNFYNVHFVLISFLILSYDGSFKTVYNVPIMPSSFLSMNSWYFSFDVPAYSMNHLMMAMKNPRFELLCDNGANSLMKV